MRVLFRCDASGEVGFGHLTRCLALAQHCEHAGDDVLFLSRRHAGTERVLQQAELNAHWLPSPQDDRRAAEPPLESIRPDWAVIDTYIDPQSEIDRLKGKANRILFIDDLGTVPHNSDLVVQPGVYTPRPPNAALAALSGPSYILLRPEIRRTGPKLTTALAEPARGVLTLGGSDRNNRTQAIAEALAGLSGPVRESLLLTVVIGAGYAYEGKLAESLKGLPVRTRLLRDLSAQAMADCLANSDFAICAAGGTAFELAYLGVPSLIVSLGPHQDAVGRALDEAGASVFLGAAETLQPSALCGAVERLLADVSLRNALHANGRSLIDGRGAERIRAAMVEGLRDA